MKPGPCFNKPYLNTLRPSDRCLLFPQGASKEELSKQQAQAAQAALPDSEDEDDGEPDAGADEDQEDDAAAGSEEEEREEEEERLPDVPRPDAKLHGKAVCCIAMPSDK